MSCDWKNVLWLRDSSNLEWFPFFWKSLMCWEPIVKCSNLTCVRQHFSQGGIEPRTKYKGHSLWSSFLAKNMLAPTSFPALLEIRPLIKRNSATAVSFHWNQITGKAAWCIQRLTLIIASRLKWSHSKLSFYQLILKRSLMLSFSFTFGKAQSDHIKLLLLFLKTSAFAQL
jgi:hypothetical protein